MATINGTAVNWGFATTTNGITITGISGTLLQTADESLGADKEDVRDGIGNIVSRAWYDQHTKATLEWVITGANIAAAVTATALAALIPGTIIVITACAGMPELIKTNWEVQAEPKISGSNTGCKRITVSLESRAGITAVAT